MPLKIFIENLETVPEAIRNNYVKRGATYQLNLSDLDEHVESKLKPLKSDLEITRAHERKLLVENGIGSALQRANIRPGYTELVIANLVGQVALETVNNKRVVRITQAEGGMPLAGSGEGGAATLDDLVKQAVESFPSMFGTGETPVPTAKDNAGGSGPKTLTRTAFDALSPIERAAKMKDGFTLVDPPMTKSPSRSIPGKTIVRAEWDKLSPQERYAKVMTEGLKLVD